MWNPNGPASKAALLLGAFSMLGVMYAFFVVDFNPVRLLKASPEAPAHLSDLYPRWIGARELLVNGRSPYSAEVTAEIQRGYWGRELDPKSKDPAGAARFWYPLYVVFLLAPTVTLNFESVRTLYVAVAAAASVASVWFWLRVLGKEQPAFLGAMASILLIGSLPVMYGLYLQQLTLLVGAMIAGGLACISAGMFGPAGILLALAMIKPQNAVAISGWLLFWSLAEWKTRWVLLASFCATIVAMLVGSEWLVPGWIAEWRASVSAYATYTDRAPAHVFIIFKSYLGYLVSGALILAAGLFCWKVRRASARSDRFRIASTLVLVVNLYLNPVWHDYDLIFLLPVILIAFTWIDQFYLLHPFGRAILIVSAFALVWQWVGAAIVLTASVASPATGSALLTLPWHSILLLPTFTLASLFVLAHSRLSAHG